MIKTFLKEPLVHFLLLGTGLFLLYGGMGDPNSSRAGSALPISAEILVTQDTLTQLVDTYTKTWQREPNETELKNLVEDFVRNEIYFREARAAGLDQDDQVIRRRLRLKMEYLFEDVAGQVEPTDQQLQAYLWEHADDYRFDPKVSFRMIFLRSDRSLDTPQSDAQTLLAQLATGTDPATLGDTFLLGQQFESMPLWEVRRQFGDAFAQTLFSQETGHWVGPLKSGFGRHLVIVDQRHERALPELTEIREVVKRDWARARQQEVKDQAYAKLRQRYKVVIEAASIMTSSTVSAKDSKVVN